MAELTVDRARVYLDHAEEAAAEPLLRQGLRVQKLFYVEDGWRIASTKSLLAAALLGLGRTAEAGPLLMAASRILPDTPGPQGRETKATRERLAALARAPAGS